MTMTDTQKFWAVVAVCTLCYFHVVWLQNWLWFMAVGYKWVSQWLN